MLIIESICTNDKIMVIIRLIKILIQMMQIIIPIALIVLGSIDFGKAVISIDEGVIKKSQKKFINRCVAAVLVFLSAIIVRGAMGFVGNTAWQECWDASSTVNPVTCVYSGAGSTYNTTITFKGSEVTYSSYDCFNQGEGLTASNFTDGCPAKIYYKINSNSPTGDKCTFTTKNKTSSGYIKITKN